MRPLLEVQGLEVHYGEAEHPIRAVDGLNLSLQRGETYALVGESGCGKSATALALLRLVEPGRIVAGKIEFDGQQLLELPEPEMRKLRGDRIAMVFQEAAAALNPVMRIGRQVGEALRVHRGIKKKEADREAVRLLRQVRLPDPEKQALAYPHELSGGMKQRVMLAIALSCEPELLIADEPTTALDVTVQAQILALLRELKQQYSLTVLLITHDLGVVAENADRVGVMYAGRLVEEAPVGQLFEQPQHPYTQGLIRAIPTSDGPTGEPLTTLPGTVPDAANPPSGCRFHPRCDRRFEPCEEQVPELVEEGGRRLACFLADTSRAVSR
jgi:oligopeptide/dipeptide ABC transporter ATP-binding protein